MAVAYRNSASFTTGNTTLSNITIPVPSGVQVGDWMFAAIAYAGPSGTTWNLSPSWQLIQNTYNGSTFGFMVYRKQVGIGEPSAYTLAFTSGATYASVVTVAYGGLRLFGAGGSYFPQSNINTLLGSGTSTPANAVTPSALPYFGFRWMMSINTSAAVGITNAGAGLTLRQDVTTTSGTFIQLALADGLTGPDTLVPVTFPAATFSGATTANYSSISFLRQDQVSLTSPSIDGAQLFFYSGATSGSGNIAASVPEQGLVAFHLQGGVGFITGVTTPANSGGLGNPLLTWRQLAAAQNPAQSTRTEVWTAVIPQGGFNYPVNFTTNVAATIDMVTLGLPATGSITNVGANAADGGTPSTSLTTTGANSRVFAFESDNNGFVASFPNGDSKLYEYSYPAGTGSARFTQRIVPSSGTAISSTVGLTADAPWSMVLVEAAAVKNSGSMFDFFN